jgi:hypothetical protein
VVVLLTAAVLLKGNSDMGVERNVPPQWGRSISSVGATQAQLVRLRLPKPTDVTLYLEGQTYNDGGFVGPAPANYRVSIGGGGVSLEQGDVFVPAVGVARHYVTDTLEVNVDLAATGLGGRRVAAAAAIGRPFQTLRVGDYIFATVAPLVVPPSNSWTKPPTFSGWTGVNNATFAFFRVPTFATRARIAVGEFAGGATAADIQVREVDWTGDTYPFQPPNPNPTAIQRVVTDYADFQPLAPQTVYLRLRCGIVGGTARVMLTFERAQ